MVSWTPPRLINQSNRSGSRAESFALSVSQGQFIKAKTRRTIMSSCSGPGSNCPAFGPDSSHFKHNGSHWPLIPWALSEASRGEFLRINKPHTVNLMFVLQAPWGGLRTIGKSSFSPSTMWMLGFNLKVSDLGADTFTHGAILQALHLTFLRQSLSC